MLTVLKLSDLINDLFITLKTKLSKAVFPCKIVFVVMESMFLFIDSTDAVDFLSVN